MPAAVLAGQGGMVVVHPGVDVRHGHPFAAYAELVPHARGVDAVDVPLGAAGGGRQARCPYRAGQRDGLVGLHTGHLGPGRDLVEQRAVTGHRNGVGDPVRREIRFPVGQQPA